MLGLDDEDSCRRGAGITPSLRKASASSSEIFMSDRPKVLNNSSFLRVFSVCSVRARRSLIICSIGRLFSRIRGANFLGVGVTPMALAASETRFFESIASGSYFAGCPGA